MAQPPPFKSLHTPTPSHLLPAPHSLSGSPPLGMNAQLPFAAPVFKLLHASQVAVQVELQQKPSTQLPLAQLAGMAQAPPLLSLQVPPPSQLESAPHSPSGSANCGMNPQVPLLPPVLAALHAWQLPEQALRQHTPSTQKPLRHSLPAPHATPTDFLQAPAPLQI
jgi:hypothetical protein